MTDSEALYSYRLKQAEDFSPRSIINRAYYAMFYALLALFIKTDVRLATSKHQGVISLFDREFVKPGLLDKRYSAMLHETFDERLEGDYKEFVELSKDDAQKGIGYAKELIAAVKRYTQAI